MALMLARFKFKGDMSTNLKEVLKRRGFTHYSGHPDWLIYVKINVDARPKPKVEETSFDWRDLSDVRQSELNRRCNKIVDKYPGDLAEHRATIKTRVTNLAETLEPREREWMLDWVRRVIDEEVETH